MYMYRGIYIQCPMYMYMNRDVYTMSNVHVHVHIIIIIMLFIYYKGNRQTHSVATLTQLRFRALPHFLI